jgi:hypothetical protein
MKHPKTIKYQGRRYNVAFITDNDVVVNLHQDEIYGHVSRLTISKPKRWEKYKA